MSEWFFSNGEHRCGPITIEELKLLVSNGEINSNTLLWAKGKSKWEKAGDTLEFATIFFKYPPPLPPKMPTERPPDSRSVDFDIDVSINSTKPRPWIRYWARWFDYLVTGIVIGTLGERAMMVNDATETFYETFHLLFPVIVVLASALIEASTMCNGRTTLGKKLFRVSVVDVTGNNPSFETAFGRTIRVAFFGMGLGVPVVTLVTMFRAFQRLKNHGVARWDVDKLGTTKFVVTHREIATSTVAIIIGITTVCYYALYLFLMSVA